MLTDGWNMGIEAFDWNVIVAGYWNRAILTPSGIARKLFGLEEGAPVEIAVPLDGIGPHRVKYAGLTVVVEKNRLVVQAQDAKFCELDHAREICSKAIDELPETPLTAAGFNVRVRTEDPPDVLLTSTKSQIDDLLSDEDFSIESRSLSRSLSWKGGFLNLNIQQGKDLRVELNFHRQSSKSKELIDWMQIPMSDVEQTVIQVFDNIIRMPLGGIGK
jgi:hypothetical protein